jgi:excisionase family DNA binding protein
MAKIQMAAFSRSHIPSQKRVPFYLYIDEFQNFASESFAVILSEARKYGLSLVMAHQTLSQVPDELRSLILGNTGIQVYFRVNRQDASLLAKEAFEYSGYEVKTVSPYGQAKYWSLGEEWERKTEEFQTLSPRFCYVKHKLEGGIIPLQTVEIEPAWEVLGMKEQKYYQFLQELPFGRKYLISREELMKLADQRKITPKEEPKKPSEVEKVISSPRKEPGKVKVKEAAISREADLTPEEMFLLDFISKNPNTFVTNIYKALNLSGYKGDRLKENLLEKELIVQEETREGRGGRLAKVLLLTVKGATLLKKTPVPGKGGDMHKHLQMTIKEQAELFDWKAVIEERIPKSLESVDVGLSRDDVRVAIEICQTTKTDQEMQNIRKCLEAGYDYVISVCSDDKSLNLIKTEAKKNFTVIERARIRFSMPGNMKGVLDRISAGAGIVSEKGIVSGQISKQKHLMDTNEASEFLGISKNTLYEWIVQKKVPHVKVGRLVKFKKDDLEEWLRKRTQEEDKREFLG